MWLAQVIITMPGEIMAAIAERIHYRSCNLCEAMCGVEIRLEQEQIVSIKGDKNDPFSRGHICPKAVALKDIYEDPDRLRKPLERTEDGWKEISWDEAYNKVAAGLQRVQQQYGHDAVATYLGNPNVHNLGASLGLPGFLRALKTRNKFSATSVDQLPHHLVCHHVFGHQLRIPVPDIDRCDFFLVFGGNPVASNGSIMSVADVKTRLKAINKRGGRVVVVDPRCSETAEIASEHFFVRPGSDVLVLLAMLQTLFAEQLVCWSQQAEYADDLADIAAAVAPYTPERVEAASGFPAASLRQLVHDFAAAETAVCYGRMGVSVQQFGALNQYLIMLINILTGRLDTEGGMMFPSPAVDTTAITGRGHFGRFHSRVRGLPEFSGEFPVAALAEEILTEGPGQVRALVTVAGNPVLSTPNGSQLDEALATLDFQVAIDFYLNETSRHANIILPPVSPLEREHYDIAFHNLAVRNTARYAPGLFERPKGGRHDWEIMQELERRLKPKQGVLAAAKGRFLTPHRALDFLLRSGPYGAGFKPFGKGLSLKKLQQTPHGVDLGALQPRLPGVIAHKDKRLHLSTDFYLPDIQRVAQVFFAADSATPEYPFLLIGRRHVRSNNSWLHNSHRLVKGKSRCTAQLHPEDAAAIGVSDGQMLRIASRTGTVEIVAELTDAIMPGVVSIPHGWGHDRQGVKLGIAAAHPGVSVNDLTDELALDALSGNAVLNGVPVSMAAV
jgi:anaerobic selenocysteine-containing dehydrogenase